MEFFVLVLMLSLMSFALATIVYGFCLKFFGVRTWFGKIAPWVLVPLIVIAYDFMVLSRQGATRIVLSLIPIAAVAVLVIYYKIAHGDDDRLEPHEMAGQKKVSKKSLKHAEKVRRREEKRQEEVARRLEKTKK
jgi:hypothetical protein